MVSTASPLVLIPFLFRTIGEETFGTLFFTQSFILYFGIIIDFGFELYAPGKIAAMIDKPSIEKFVLTVQSVKFLIGAIFFLVGLLLLFVFDTLFIKKYTIAWFYMVYMQALVPTWFFQGIGDLGKISLIQAVGKVLTVLITFILVQSSDDAILYPLIEGTILMLIAFGAWRTYFKLGYHLAPVEWKEMTLVMRESASLLVSKISISLYTISGTFILGLLTSPKMVAYYTAPMKIIESVSGLMGPVNQVVYPYISSHISKNTGRVDSVFLKRYIWTCLVFSLLVTLVLILARDFIVYDYLKAQEQIVGSIFLVLAFIPIFVFFSNVLGIQILLGFKFKEEFSRIVVSSSVIGFILIIVFTYFIGPLGTSISILATEALIAAWMYVRVRKIVL